MDRIHLLEQPGTRVSQILWLYDNDPPDSVACFKITQIWHATEGNDEERRTIFLFIEELEELVQAARDYVEGADV